MTESKTRNFNNFNELKEIIEDSPANGLTVVLVSKTKENSAVGQLVAHHLSSNSNSLTEVFPVIDGTESLTQIRERALHEYDSFGQPGALLVDETYRNDALAPEVSGQLVLLAKDLGIKVTLLTYSLTPFMEQDASLIVKVNATEESNHSLEVLKNRRGRTGTIEFTYEDQPA
jgi:hypothetical protein